MFIKGKKGKINRPGSGFFASLRFAQKDKLLRWRDGSRKACHC